MLKSTLNLGEITALEEPFVNSELEFESSSEAPMTREEERMFLDLIASPRLAKWRWLARWRSVRVVEGYDLRIVDQKLTVGRSLLYEDRSQHLLKRGAGGTQKLRGLYFPSATPSLNLMCMATLYFDEFYVIHPGSSLLSKWSRPVSRDAGNDPSAALYTKRREEFLNRLRLFDRETASLKQAGILCALPPQMQRRPEFVEFITADLGDDEFARIVRKHAPWPVFVAADKLEPILPLVGEGLDVDEVRKHLKHRGAIDHGSDPDDFELFHTWRYGAKEVDPVLGASILLNHALLLSEQSGLIPFTDDNTSNELLRCKLRRVSNDAGFAEYRKRLNLGAATLGIRVLEEFLPKFHFERIDDALEARCKLDDRLSAFREAMLALAADIQESPYDETFMERVERTIASRVRPAVRNLENEIQKSRDSFVSKCLRNIQTGAIPIAASIFAGLPTEAVIAVSAGVLSLGAAMETYREIKRVKANGLTLLLGL